MMHRTIEAWHHRRWKDLWSVTGSLRGICAALLFPSAQNGDFLQVLKEDKSENTRSFLAHWDIPDTRFYVPFPVARAWTTVKCGPLLDRVKCCIHFCVFIGPVLKKKNMESLASQCGPKHREKRGSWTCYFPCSRSWWGKRWWRWKYSKRSHLWFHPGDNLLPRMWCFTWLRETQRYWASFKQDSLQIQSRVVEMHCVIWSARPFPLQLLSSTGISSSPCSLCFIFLYITAD